MIGQLGRTFRILAERFLNDDPGPSGGGHAGFFDHGCHRSKHRRRQRQVEETVSYSCHFFFQIEHFLIEHFKVPFGVVTSGHIRVGLPKLLVPSLFFIFDLE